MVRKHQATERLSLEAAAARLPQTQAHLDKLLARLERIRPPGPRPVVLDIGAASGLLLICCARKGLRAIGVEPWQQAREIAEGLARREGVRITMLSGRAAALPCPAGQFDLVHASSVIEHVEDPQEAFNEACRVLKPGGIFWFLTASSLCPRQLEIAGFPCFAWYPDRLKRRIMRWAKARKPHLIGHTDTPAMHWFTPWKARRMLRKAGFRRVYDRWDLRGVCEGGRLHGIALRAVRLCILTRALADVFVPACSYAAVK